MSKPPMIQRTYRVPKSLYDAAIAMADERQENLSDVIREALERYTYPTTASAPTTGKSDEGESTRKDR